MALSPVATSLERVAAPPVSLCCCSGTMLGSCWTVLYYGNQNGRLEYDFIVAPGSNPNAIALAIVEPPEAGSGKSPDPVRLTHMAISSCTLNAAISASRSQLSIKKTVVGAGTISTAGIY